MSEGIERAFRPGSRLYPTLSPSDGAGIQRPCEANRTSVALPKEIDARGGWSGLLPNSIRTVRKGHKDRTPLPKETKVTKGMAPIESKSLSEGRPSFALSVCLSIRN